MKMKTRMFDGTKSNPTKKKMSARKALISMGQSFRKGLSVTIRKIGQLSPTKRSTKNIKRKGSSKKMEDVWNRDVERVRRVSRGMKGRLGFAPGLMDSKGRKSFIEVAQNERTHEEEEAKRSDIRNTLTKFSSSVGEGDASKNSWKEKMGYWLEHTATEIAMMILTIFALYASDLNVMYGESSGDNLFGMFSFVAMIIFFVEVAVASVVKPKYFLRAFFWLDFVAAISLISDIPWLAVLLLPSGFAAARAGRASRAGTRAGRLVRVIRLIRLTKLVKVREMLERTSLSLSPPTSSTNTHNNNDRY